MTVGHVRAGSTYGLSVARPNEAVATPSLGVRDGGRYSADMGSITLLSSLLLAAVPSILAPRLRELGEA